MVAVGALLTAEQLSALASRGYPIGLAELDDLTRGLLPEALWVVFGTSGVGRTVFACQVAARAAEAGADTALVLGREPASVAAANLVCAHARVADHRLRSGRLDAREADRSRASAREIAGWPLRVLTPQDPEWEFSKSTSVPGLDHWVAPGAIPTRRVADVLVVDDLDALTTRPVLDVLCAMRTWARTTGQAIVVTLPEAPFVTGGVLSADVRREADVAVRLCRPDLHNVGSARAGEADLDVLGHRQGPTARVVAAFEGHYRRFADLPPPIR
ncbi:MAG: DnaB-like helicase C-terminal domain-containing protein [Mycobacteriales bacterium]